MKYPDAGAFARASENQLGRRKTLQGKIALDRHPKGHNDERAFTISLSDQHSGLAVELIAATGTSGYAG
jgi:hypothetical protein